MTYEQFAKQLASDAGEEIRKNFQLNGDREWKEDGSPVTKTDMAINKMVIERVAQTFPDHGVKGEEESDYTGDEEYLWVCDPVDGTTPFSHGIPTCVFSIALVRDGDPVLGTVYDPLLDRLFFAEKGQGAFLNDQPIEVSRTDAFTTNLVIASSFGRGDLVDLYPVAGKLKDHGVHVINLQCHIYAGMLVAAGELGAVLFRGKGAHDGAALKVLVEEAGGKVTDILGKPQRYDQNMNGQLVSNGLLHEPLLELIREHGLKDE